MMRMHQSKVDNIIIIVQDHIMFAGRTIPNIGLVPIAGGVLTNEQLSTLSELIRLNQKANLEQWLAKFSTCQSWTEDLIMRREKNV